MIYPFVEHTHEKSLLYKNKKKSEHKNIFSQIEVFLFFYHKSFYTELIIFYEHLDPYALIPTFWIEVIP